MWNNRKGYPESYRVSSLMLYFLIELEHFKEFDVENKGGEGWNAIACTVFSIGEVVGEVEAVFGTFFHKLYAFGPTGDDLVESKVGGLVPLVGTVEDCSINEGSVVVAAYGVSSLGAATGAFGEYFVCVLHSLRGTVRLHFWLVHLLLQRRHAAAVPIE